jgi:WD40 repeat protein/predicted Ser/Thr protein kinase
LRSWIKQNQVLMSSSPSEEPFATPPGVRVATLPTDGVSLAGLTALVRADQAKRWRGGERVRVEDYLAQYANLSACPDAVLDLVYAEFVLREDLGELPLADEYLKRFPAHAEALRRQFDLHEALREQSISALSGSSDSGVTEVFASAATSPAAGVSQMPMLPPVSDAGEVQTRGDESSTWSQSEALSRSSVVVPGYEVLGLLGKGGMGVVYKARQIGLDRIVALKMLLRAEHAGPVERQRFKTEAEAVGRLQHPHIVQIHEIGEHDGLPFFSLEFCGGGSLDKKLTGAPWLPREAAALVETLARAVQAAHQKGIIHRDLKPANVLLAEDNTPKITDFGLARKLDEAGQTASGAIMGTPSYMPPEQAGGKSKELGPAADVYALGAILYELLTGRPPFKAATPLDTILQVVSDEPVTPTQLHSRTPRDLETICLKCLEKEPARRYASAAALAEDLRRFQAGEPITARPIGPLARCWRWARRNPLLAASGLLVASCLLGGTAVSTHFGLRAEQARQAEAERAVTEAEAKQVAERARRDALRQLIDLSGASGLAAAHDGDHSLALLWFARAVQLAHDEPDQQELNRVRAANWLRHVSLPQETFALTDFQQHRDRVHSLQFSPDGGYLLTRTSTDGCLLWDWRRGCQVALPRSVEKPHAAAWEPNKGLLAVADQKGRIQLLAPPDFQPVEKVMASGEVSVLAFSRDGQRLAWGGSDGARVWDRGSREYASPRLPHPAAVQTLSLSASGRLLVTSAGDQKARVFRLGVDKDEPLFPPVPHSRPEHGLAHGGPGPVAPRFAAGDQVLLTIENIAQGRHRLVWRSALTGKLLTARVAPPGQEFLTAFAVSPRGDRVAAMWEDRGWLWDSQTQRVLAAIETGGRSNWCEDVVFTPDGKTLITVGHNMLAQFWSVEERPNGALVAAFPPILHPMKLVRVVASPDGQHLAAALWDGTIYQWVLPAGVPRAYSLPAGGATLPVLSPDGRFVLPGGTTFRNGTQLSTRIHDATTGKAAGPILAPGGILLNAVFDPEGMRVATASSTAHTIGDRNVRLFEPAGKSGNVQVWDWRTGKRLAGPIATPSEPRGLAFHLNGRTLAVVCADYRVVLIDPGSGTIRANLDPGIRTRPLNANLWWGNGEARFSPDGRFLVTWEMAAPVHVWDADTGELLNVLAHDERVESVAFNPTVPELLATAGRDSVARVWDLRTGRPLARLSHPSQLSRVRFSPDGSELLTSCSDGMLRVWDWRAGELKEGLALHASALMDFGFTANHRWLATLSLEDLQVTDWRSKTPASPRWLLGKNVQVALAMPAGDSRVIVGGFSGSLEAFDLKAMTSPASGPAEELTALAELAAGRRILSQGSVVPLNSSEWSQRWRRLKGDRRSGPQE